jgi:hypothetical protein
MKKKKFNELIQKPLRFHHQDIHEELEEIKGMIRDVNNQMQELREAIRRTPVPTTLLPMPQPHQHPWWEYQRYGSIPCRNNNWGQVSPPNSIFDQAGSTISGTEKAS